MKRLKSYREKLSAGILVIVVLLTAAVSCSKDDDDNGNDPGGNNGSSVKIQDFDFSPSTITVTVGTTVTWRNFDNIAHTVTSDDGLFDSGSILTSGTFSHTFNTAGTFDYHCTPHPEMTASVVVN